MQGLVFKKLADKFWVKVDDSVYICVARKNLKDKGVFVGDRVEIDTNNNPATIEKIADRKNIFIRPPLCNLDVLVITLAQIPEPDYAIVDKLILFSLCYGVEPTVLISLFISCIRKSIFLPMAPSVHSNSLN